MQIIHARFVRTYAHIHAYTLEYSSAAAAFGHVLPLGAISARKFIDVSYRVGSAIIPKLNSMRALFFARGARARVSAYKFFINLVQAASAAATVGEKKRSTTLSRAVMIFANN